MKAFVIHDPAGAIHSIAIAGEQGKLQVRPDTGPGYRVAELELPTGAAEGDPHSPGFHTRMRALLKSHKVSGEKLVAIDAAR